MVPSYLFTIFRSAGTRSPEEKKSINRIKLSAYIKTIVNFVPRYSNSCKERAFLNYSNLISILLFQYFVDGRTRAAISLSNLPIVHVTPLIAGIIDI